MTTRIEAAQALESFAWALVKYAQKVQKSNWKGEHDWLLRAKVRLYMFKKAKRNYLIPNTRKFVAGKVPVGITGPIDVFCHYDDEGDTRITYSVPANAMINAPVMAWRYAI